MRAFGNIFFEGLFFLPFVRKMGAVCKRLKGAGKIRNA